MAEPYEQVMSGLRQMLAEGKPRADAEQYATAMGWTLDELKSASQGSGLTDVTAPILQGVSFGFGDEISAGLRTGFGVLGDYGETLAQERALVKRAESNNPVGSTVAEVGGAVAGGVASAPLAIGKTALGTLGRAVGLGAAEGGLYGAGKGENAQERLEGAGQGAALGAALAPVVAGAGNLIGRGARKIKQGVIDSAAPKTAARERINQALARDGMTADDLNQALARQKAVRPEAQAMDAGGEALRTQTELLAQSPGAARSIIKPGMEARQINQINRLSDDLKALTGSKQTALQATNELVDQRAAAAKPLYDQAYQERVRGDALAAFLGETSKGFGKQALESPKYRRLLETQYGIKNPTKAPSGTVAVDLRLVDGWKRVVQDMENAAIRAGNNNEARVLGDMRRRVIDPIRASNKAYDDALKEWSGASQFIDNIDLGKSAFQKMTAEEMDQFMKNASTADAEAFRIGAVTNLINRMEADRSKMADFTKFFRGEGMRKKMLALMPNDAARQKWSKIFESEQAMTELTAQSLSNSATARRMMARADAEGGDVFDLILELSQGSPGLFEMVRRWVGGAATGLKEKAIEKTNAEMAKILSAKTPQEFNALMAQGRLPVRYNQGASRLTGGGAMAGANIAAPEQSQPAFPY